MEYRQYDLSASSAFGKRPDSFDASPDLGPQIIIKRCRALRNRARIIKIASLQLSKYLGDEIIHLGCRMVA
jgi:hypothetical protein